MKAFAAHPLGSAISVEEAVGAVFDTYVYYIRQFHVQCIHLLIFVVDI